jgi:hypothetical protein
MHTRKTTIILIAVFLLASCNAEPEHCTDLDNDGYRVGADCPIDEIFDCLDTDATLNWDDIDGDGYSTCAYDCDDYDATLNRDDLDSDHSTSCDGDCDDSNPSINPARRESCMDGVDNNCDGLVDISGYSDLFWHFYFSFSLDIEGDAGIGSVTIRADGLGEDAHYPINCGNTAQYESTVSTGVDQGPAVWEYIDEVVNWDTPTTVLEDDCVVSPDCLFGAGLWPERFTWENGLDACFAPFNPLTFVSCDSIRMNIGLSELPVGPDLTLYPTSVEQLTFGEHCDEIGPIVENIIGSGEIEGIWMIPMEETWSSSGWELYQPEDSTQIQYWGIAGYLMQDIDTTPASYLDGRYRIYNRWIWDESGRW